MSTEGQRIALLQREVDVGFLIGPFSGPGIDSVTMRRENLCVVLPVGHALVCRKRVALADLRDEPFVLGNQQA